MPSLNANAYGCQIIQTYPVLFDSFHDLMERNLTFGYFELAPLSTQRQDGIASYAWQYCSVCQWGRHQLRFTVSILEEEELHVA